MFEVDGKCFILSIRKPGGEVVTNDWKHQENHWGRCPLGCKDENLDVDSDQNMANEVTFS